MLRQVLHNHLTTQSLPVLSALTAVGRLLGHLARQLHGLGYDLQRFAEDTVATLGGQLLVRLRDGEAPLLPLPAPALTGEMTAEKPAALVEPDHAQEVGDALWRLLKETSADQQLTPVGARWVAINLAADVLYGAERLLHPTLGPDDIEDIMDWFYISFTPPLITFLVYPVLSK
ncbi:MAG TPA: hypothetical protein VIH59_00605 [Candidatus Tectomicrobia bacterium]